MEVAIDTEVLVDGGGEDVVCAVPPPGGVGEPPGQVGAQGHFLPGLQLSASPSY